MRPKCAGGGGEPTGRQRASPHIKSYCRYLEEGEEVAWFLLTSANLSRVRGRL